MSLTGVFCFSWVGAICDSTIPSCRGDDDLHTALVVTFFALMDV